MKEKIRANVTSCDHRSLPAYCLPALFVLIALMSSACTEGIPDFEDLGKSIDPPGKFNKSDNFYRITSLTENLNFSGWCDARTEALQLSRDETSWTDISQWVTADSDTSCLDDNSFSVQLEQIGSRMEFSEGVFEQRKLYIRSTFSAGTTTSSSITISYESDQDLTAPTAPSSLDDGTETTDSTQSPPLSWGAASDAESGLSHYEVALGTSAGTTDVVTWTDVGNTTSYTFTGLSLSNSQTYYAAVRAVDQQGNISPKTDGNGFLVNLPKPTVTLSTTASDPTKLANIPIDVVFSESVTDFTAADVVLSSGSLANFSGSGTTYSFDISPSGDGAIQIDVPADAAFNNFSVGNQAASTLSITSDQTAPTEPTSLSLQDPTTSPNSSSSVKIKVSGVTTGDWITLFSDSSCSTSVQSGQASNTYIYLTVTLPTQQEYTFYATAKDAAGNESPCSTASVTYTYDATRPSVTINQSATQSDPTSSLPVEFTVQFSEAIDANSFSTADIVHRGSALGVVWSITAIDNQTFTLKAEASGSSGTFKPKIYAEKVADLAGNLNAASTSTDNEVTYNMPGAKVSFLQVTSGASHSCGITKKGKAFCWGLGSYGRLGNNAVTDHASPVAVYNSNKMNFKSIAAGGYHTCGITAHGKAYCWGRGTVGQLGHSAFTDSSTPVSVEVSGISATSFRSISAGSDHTCGLSVAGQAYCWGEGASGRLGNGSTEDASVPQIVNATGYLFKTISAGSNHTCALAEQGSIFCWGYGASGQLGNGSQSTAESLPVLVETSHFAEGLAREFISLDVGMNFSCGITSDGFAHCWGDNTNSRLGTSDGATEHYSPVKVFTSQRFQQISLGATHSCATTAKGEVYCWGDGTSGRLGTGDTTTQPSPVKVASGHLTRDKSFVSVAAGSAHSCALTTDRKVYCWGSGNSGRLGTGSTSQQTSAAALSDSHLNTAITFKEIHTSYHFSCGLTDNGHVYCWGRSLYGELADLDGTDHNVATPQPISTDHLTTLKTFETLSLGKHHACALRTDGILYCWGYNGRGALGQGDTVTSYTSPVPVDTSTMIGAKTFKKVTAGATHTCGIATDGVGYCWGYEEYGMLGTGVDSPNDTTRPDVILTTNLTGDKKWIDLDAAGASTCGIASTGQAFCWGSPGNGRLGNGDATTYHSTPQAVSSAKKFSKIFADYRHSCGLTTEGDAYCWGKGLYGRLGNGDTLDQLTPVLVNTSNLIGSKKFTSIDIGPYHGCGISDGELYCWGAGTNGQLGTGGTTDRVRPVPVETHPLTGAKTFLSVSSGDLQTCALTSDGMPYCWGLGEYGRLADGDTTIHDVVTPKSVGVIGLPAP